MFPMLPNLLFQGYFLRNWKFDISCRINLIVYILISSFIRVQCWGEYKDLYPGELWDQQLEWEIPIQRFQTGNSLTLPLFCTMVGRNSIFVQTFKYASVFKSHTPSLGARVWNIRPHSVLPLSERDTRPGGPCSQSNPTNQGWETWTGDTVFPHLSDI